MAIPSASASASASAVAVAVAVVVAVVESTAGLAQTGSLALAKGSSTFAVAAPACRFQLQHFAVGARPEAPAHHHRAQLVER